jgi:hypothetical protein
MTRTTTGRIAIAAALLITAGTALAGPPLICHPFDIGDTPSLSWGVGNNWSNPKPGYDAQANLVKDTLGLLAPGSPVIVRMETLRRAAIYSHKDAALANELLNRLMVRTMNAEAAGKPDALAWFDAGYLAESYRQLEAVEKRSIVASLDGYAWVLRSLRMGADPASVEFAASLMRHERGWPNAHYRKAAASAPKGSLLARNVESFK